MLPSGTCGTSWPWLYPQVTDQFAKRQPGISEPVVALPVSAGGQRDFWLATYARAGRVPQVATEVSSADAKFQIVSSGAAINAQAEGNADVSTRPGIVCIPVIGLQPARLAIAWRRVTTGRRFVTSFAPAARRPVPQAVGMGCRVAGSTGLPS